MQSAETLEKWWAITGADGSINHDKRNNFIEKHPHQTGNEGEFAVYVTNNSMAPRFEEGDLLFLAITPARKNSYALIELHSGEYYVCYYESTIGEKVMFKQLDDQKMQSLDAQDIKKIYPIVGTG